MVRNLWPWIGFLLTLLVSSLSSWVAGSGPLERNYVFARLEQERSYGQTFVVEQGDLVGIRVLLFPPRQASADLVTVRLHFPDDNLPDLAYATMPVQRLSTRGMTTFRFGTVHLPEIPDGSMPTLQFTLEAPDLESSDGITVMGGPDTYPGGQLYRDGIPDERVDLAFQPVYRVRWFDWILPLSRMADGKPGILGWPPFYALLAYGYFYFLLKGLLRLRQKRAP